MIFFLRIENFFTKFCFIFGCFPKQYFVCSNWGSFWEKNDFFPTIQNFKQNFLAGKKFSQEYFFQFYFPNCLSHKILFFIKLKKIFWKKKGKKNATENYFSGKKRKNDFFSEKIESITTSKFLSYSEKPIVIEKKCQKMKKIWKKSIFYWKKRTKSQFFS